MFSIIFVKLESKSTTSSTTTHPHNFHYNLLHCNYFHNSDYHFCYQDHWFIVITIIIPILAFLMQATSTTLMSSIDI